MRTDVYLRTWKERWDTNVNLEPALNLLDYLSSELSVSLEGLFHLLPDLLLICLLLREKNLTQLILKRDNENVYLITNLSLNLSLYVGELLSWNYTFGLEADINRYHLFADMCNDTRNYLTWANVAETAEHESFEL